MPLFDGFVGDAYTAPSITQDDQATFNWYPEIDIRKPEDARGVVALYPTPGMRAWNTAGVNLGFGGYGPVRGLFVIPKTAALASHFAAAADLTDGVVLAVMGPNIFMTNGPSGSEFGQSGINALTGATLLTSTGPVSMTSNGVQVMITDGTNRYSLDISTFAFTVLTDGAWPGGVRCDIVDGFIVYNQGGTKQWAATNNLSTATPALSFASSLSSYDNLVSIFVDKRQVALLGEQTSEWWTDSGTFPFPFAISPGTTRQFGCAAPYSVARFGDGLAMLSKDQQGTNVVVMIVNYEMARISTHAIENDLIGQVTSDAYAFTYQLAGHVFYVLQFPTANRTWVYDLATQMWHRWTSTDAQGAQQRHVSTSAVSYKGLILVGSPDGGIYALDNSYPKDDVAQGLSTPFPTRFIRRSRRCPHITNDLNRQYFDRLQIQFQPGVGTETGQGADPQAMLRWSDDGGFTWSNEHWTGLGRVGQYKNRAQWQRLGMARDRIFEVAITDPVYAVIVSADLTVTPGAN